MTFDYNVIIIGSGPAGFACAMQSTKFDKKVLIVEANDEFLGGNWINKGTVPSKALREATKLIQSFHDQFDDDQSRKPYDRFKMEDLLRYKKNIINNKNRKLEDDLTKNEVDIARGRGRVTDKHTVEITDSLNNKTTCTAEHIYIATGSRPSQATGFNVDHANILDYDSVLGLTHIPRRLAIVGSEALSFEYATIFASLGTRVNILSESPQDIPYMDHEIRDHLYQSLRKKKIQIFEKATVKDVKANTLRTCLEVLFDVEGEDRLQVIETEYVLYIGGKSPNTEDLGLQETGIKLSNEGFIEVDESFQTSVSSIYAGGDVTGGTTLASAAFVEGRLAACHMFNSTVENFSVYSPHAIYSIPEISCIGLTEEEAQAQNLDVTIGRSYYKNLTQADLHQESEGLLKLVFRTDNLKLLGVHIIGDQASDMIHLGQCIMATGGDIRYFIDQIVNYPSYAEAYRVAAFNGVNRVSQSGVKYRKILEGSNA